ncbi:tetratricopeptide repeat protein [Patescibacteria group bacterium]|nr:tetratricopeptide repeat protein [Patescibacteria group bacterium]
MSLVTIVGLILAIGGFAGVVFMIARKIPTLVKTEEFPTLPQTSLAEGIKNKIKALRYSTYRPLVLESLEKSLRRLRLFILKIDNFFVGLIKRSREKSQVWKIRSHAWSEHRRLKKREKLQVLERLDKVEVSETLEKIKQEVAKEEDNALKEKIEAMVNGETAEVIPLVQPEILNSEANVVSPAVENTAVTEEEKKHIDRIAENHKDVDAYRALGFLYLNQKNYSDARACFRRALKLNPQDEEVKNKLNEIKGLRAKKQQGAT